MVDPVSRQREHFNAIACEYATARSSANHLEFKFQLWNSFLQDKRNLFGVRPAVLEPMCGGADGYHLLTSHLERELDYSGFDVSDAMIRNARERSADLQLWQADVTKFKPSGMYDLVLLLGGLHHVPHVATEVVAALAKAVRPGGFFLSWEPTQGNALFKSIRNRIYDRNAIFESTTERAFDVQELFTAFEQAGLRLVDVCFPGLLGYVLYYNPDAFPVLNVGSPSFVRALWRIERPFIRTWLARKLSFATLSLWQRPATTLSEC